MAATVHAGHPYAAEFEALDRQGGFRSPTWLAALRRRALERFAGLGFPTTRDEDWRYTSLAALATAPLPLAPADGAPDPAAQDPGVPVAGAEGPRLVFVDGRYSPKLSAARPLPGGGWAGSLAEALMTHGPLVERHLASQAGAEGDALAALNTAFFADGALVWMPAEARAEAPVELLFLTTAAGARTHPRVLIVAGPHSRLAVIERHAGRTGALHLANPVTEIDVGPGAAVDHYAVQEQGDETFHLATVQAVVERDGVLRTCGVAFGGRLARTTLAVRFAGQGGRAAINGLYVAGGRQHVDHHVTVDHAVPRCASEQLFKGVLDGASRAVFSGRIVVRPDAQKTDATQTNKHLLLSDGVEVDSKPQLEIFADDVRCTHGAAEGQLAPEALFYLRSRGLGEETARALLTHGFAREVLERVAVEPLRDHLDRLLTARLAPRPAAKESA